LIAALRPGRLTVNGLLAALVVLAALLGPRFLTRFSTIDVLTTAGVFAMFAASWDILSGYTGQENFGHAAFIGAGGFTVGLLTKYADVPVEVSMLAAAAIAGLLGLVIGIPALRLRGPYLALATLAAAAALLRLAFIFKPQTGGEEGISGLAKLGDGALLGPIGRGAARIFYGDVGGLNRLNEASIVNYYVVLLAATSMVAVLAAYGASKRGLLLRSIQQDETAALASGVSTASLKVAAFVVSSTLAGIAGSLWVHTLTQVNIDTLRVDLSLLIIVMAVIGGAGSIVGPAIGAVIIVLLQDLVLDRLGIDPGSQVKPMLFSALLIVVMIVRPKGLVVPLLRRLSGRAVIARARPEGADG